MLGPYRIPQHAHGSLLTRKKPMWQVARDGTDVTRGGWGGASSPAGPRGEEPSSAAAEHRAFLPSPAAPAPSATTHGAAVQVQALALQLRTVALHAQAMASHARATALHAQTAALHTQTAALHVQTAALHVQTTALHAQAVALHTRTVALHTHALVSQVWPPHCAPSSSRCHPQAGCCSRSALVGGK